MALPINAWTSVWFPMSPTWHVLDETVDHQSILLCCGLCRLRVQFLGRLGHGHRDVGAGLAPVSSMDRGAAPVAPGLSFSFDEHV